MLAAYACHPEQSRGRHVVEAERAFRDCFQRDRDRIIHSSAFRRLKYKTQVFVEQEGDYYCTRLTHSLEVEQVARSLARALGLNVDLAEAISLAHDLGHPPFAHSGEDTLQKEMAEMGGFDHNAQAFRIVTRLECHYADFDGLNLSWETLEGIVKHNGPLCAPFAFGLEEACNWLRFDTYASAEAQVAALADDIAYNNRDMQDGLRAGFFTDRDILYLPLFGQAFEDVERRWPGLEAGRCRHQVLRTVFGAMVEDVIKTSRAWLERKEPASADAIRDAGESAIQFSPAMGKQIRCIGDFLFENMYRAPSVMEKRKEASAIVSGLFGVYMERPEEMPHEWRADLAGSAERATIARRVADYLSGMTDRFAYQEAERLKISTSPPHARL